MGSASKSARSYRHALSLLLGYLAVLVVGLFVQQQFFNDYKTYLQPVWADGSGYYSYLPATFHYGWEVAKMPDEAPSWVGYGFSYEIDSLSGTTKLHTKYAIGPAVLISPFYLVQMIAQSLTDRPPSPTHGFEMHFLKSVVYAATFYLYLGCILLVLFLRKWFTLSASVGAVLSMVLGSNVLNYSLFEPSYSHIYGFYAIIVFLRQTHHWLSNPRSWQFILGFGFSAGLVVLIRPLDFPILLLVPGLLMVKDWASLKKRLFFLLENKIPLFAAVACSLMVFAPQMFYWKYLFGEWFYWSYGEEGFTNALSPDLWYTLTGPVNGLFSWTPIALVAVVGLVVLVVKNYRQNSLHTTYTYGFAHPSELAWLGLAGFLIITYTTAAWWLPTFGCSKGMRNAVDYWPLWVAGLAWIWQTTMTKSRYWRIGLIVLLTLLAVYNIKLTFLHIGCFLGSADYWNDWLRILKILNQW